MAFSPALVGVKPTAAQHGLMRNSFAKKLPVPARQPVLISAFLGEKSKLQRLSVSALFTSRSGAGWKRWKTLRDGRRNVFAQVGDDGVLPFSRKSLHSGAKRAERTAVAQVDFAVTEEEKVGGRRGASRLADTGKKNNGLFGLAEGSDDEYSEEEYSDEEEEEDGEVLEVDGETVGEDELAIASLGIAPEIVDALVKRGITHLFPIQRAVLTPAMDGRDLIGRAKTGTGKTLAFGVPIIDRIIQENQQNRFARRSGRDPRALVLAPTRELAKQVEREFMESAPSLSTICVYGGVSITAQLRQLQKGVDIAVGTPGRIIDLIERGSLKLNEVQFLVLDEADQMLAVGFEEDVEHILEQLPAERQSMLFSATMPTWVKKLARKYLNEPLTIDLVGESDEKLAEGIKLYAVQSVASAKRTILTDLITVYAKGEKTIIFTQTKRDADEVSLTMGRMLGCEALHGDITQAQREKTLNAFREGRFSVLVATDVAARGLDIPNVDLVVHYEIPNDPETFVHRSGRTGRAGKAGTAILMYTGNQSRTMMQIERDVGSKFEKITPPSSHEVILASSDQAKELIKKVHPELIETFLPTAEKLLEENGPSALAAAIAHLSGFSQPPTSRSLLTFEEGVTTMRILRTNRTRGGRLTSARVVMGTLAGIYPPAADQIGKIRIIDDPRVEGAVFDLPEDVAKDLLGKPCTDGDVIDVPKVLPRIEEEESRGRTDSYGRFSGGGGRGGGRGTVYTRSTRDDRRRGGRDSGSRFGDRRSDFGEGRFEDRNQSNGRRFDFDDDWNGAGSRRSSRGSDRGGRGGPFSGVCYVCNQPGHRASDCPDGRR